MTMNGNVALKYLSLMNKFAQTGKNNSDPEVENFSKILQDILKEQLRDRKNNNNQRVEESAKLLIPKPKPSGG